MADRTIQILTLFVLILFIWNVLLVSGVIKTKYNSAEKMTAVDGPPASGIMPFDDTPSHKPQSETTKVKLIDEQDSEYMHKYGGAFGEGNKVREAMHAYHRGQGVHMSAPVMKTSSSPGPATASATAAASAAAASDSSKKEHYGGASSMGNRRKKRRKEDMGAIPKAASSSLPPLKPIGIKPYSTFSDPQSGLENLVDPTGVQDHLFANSRRTEGRGYENFIYTEKMQAFENGESYKVVTGKSCSGSPINHLTDMVIDTCQAHCAHDRQFAAFAYNFSNGDCRTYSSCKRLTPDDDKVQTFSRGAGTGFS